MVCAACCHIALVFAVMHLYDIIFICNCFCSFLFYTFFTAVLINRQNSPQYLYAFFFNSGDTKGTNSSKILCLMFVYVLFYVNLCTGLILWVFFKNNLWFDDLRTE